VVLSSTRTRSCFATPRRVVQLAADLLSRQPCERGARRGVDLGLSIVKSIVEGDGSTPHRAVTENSRPIDMR
jgi:hypothetical protein